MGCFFSGLILFFPQLLLLWLRWAIMSCFMCDTEARFFLRYYFLINCSSLYNNCQNAICIVWLNVFPRLPTNFASGIVSTNMEVEWRNKIINFGKFWHFILQFPTPIPMDDKHSFQRLQLFCCQRVDYLQ